MNRSEYYSAMRSLALEKRKLYGVSTNNIKISVVLRIYREVGIKIDRSNTLSPKIRAAYFCDDGYCSVLLNSTLPKEPKLFSLVHELKHHFVDRSLIQEGKIQCGDYNKNEVIEIGAEIFAAEFIFPESEMKKLITSLGINEKTCNEKSVVDIRRNSSAPISYTFIVKRLTRFGFIKPNAFKNFKFKNLEEHIYGKPFYEQPWFRNKRRQK